MKRVHICTLLSRHLALVHDIQPFGTKKFNLTHTIRHLSFGEDYPGQTHPLDGYQQVATEDPPTGNVELVLG